MIALMASVPPLLSTGVENRPYLDLPRAQRPAKVGTSGIRQVANAAMTLSAIAHPVAGRMVW
jgi:hypothetical protein